MLFTNYEKGIIAKREISPIVVIPPNWRYNNNEYTQPLCFIKKRELWDIVNIFLLETNQ